MNTLSGTNIAAINAISNGNFAHKKISSSLERLASGTRVNSYKDNITSSLANTSANSQISAISSDVQNVNETLSMLRIADKALEDQIRILNKVRAKAVSAASDGVSRRDRSALQNEIRLLFDDLDEIAQQTTYQGKKLLTGEYLKKNIALGSKSNEQYRYSIGSSQSDDIGRVRYETTNGGSRNIDDLSLTFKEIGINKEDVRLDPFVLSSTTGKTLKDLANHVNASTNRLGGIRAIYKEGVAPNKEDTRRIIEYRKSLVGAPTTSFYQEKDFEYVDYSEKVKKIKTVVPVKRENFTFKSDAVSLGAGLLPELKDGSGSDFVGLVGELSLGSETLVSPVGDSQEKSLFSPDSKSSVLPSGTMGTREIKTVVPAKRENFTFDSSGVGVVESSSLGATLGEVEPVGEFDGDIPYHPVFRTRIEGVFLEDETTDDGSIKNKVIIDLEDTLVDTKKINGAYTFDASTVANRIGFDNGPLHAFPHSISHGNPTAEINVDGTVYNIRFVNPNNYEISTISGPGKHHTVEIAYVLASGAYWEGNRVKVSGIPPFKVASSNLNTGGNTGLSISYRLIDNKKVEIELKGKASPHAIDRNGIRFNFDGLFSAGTTPSAVSASINFFAVTPAPTIDTNTFSEVDANDGNIRNTMIIDLKDKVIGDDFTLNDENIPAGLTASYVLQPDKQTVKVTLDGTANSHKSKDDLENIKFSFAGTFSGGVTPGFIDGISIDFYSKGRINPIFTEKLPENDGSIGNSAIIDLKDDILDSYRYQFPTAVGKDVVEALKFGTNATIKQKFNIDEIYDLNVGGALVTLKIGIRASDTKFYIETTKSLLASHFPLRLSVVPGKDVYTGPGSEFSTTPTRITALPTVLIQNKPTNITPVYTVLNASQIQVTLTGSAIPHVDDIDNLGFTFIGNFSAGIGPAPITDASINFFAPAPIATLDTNIFSEVDADDGHIRNTIIIDLKDKVSPYDFILNDENIPRGLTVSYALQPDNQTVKVTLDGIAKAHKDRNDLENIRFSFAGTFDGGVTPRTIDNISIDFISTPIVAKLIPIFREKLPQNNGTIGNSSIINLGNDLVQKHRRTASSAVAGTQKVDLLRFQVAGVEVRINQVFDYGKEYSIILGGVDYNILLGQDTSTGSRFTFIESDTKLPSDVRFSLAGSTDENAIMNKQSATPLINPVTGIQNSPAGLTPEYVVLNPSQVQVTLIGRGIPHVDDVDNLGFTFNGNFEGGDIPPPITNGSIDFIDTVPRAKFVGTQRFKEEKENYGIIGNDIVIDLGVKVKSPSPYLFSNNILIEDDATALSFFFSTAHGDFDRARGIVVNNGGFTNVPVDPNETLEKTVPLNIASNKAGIYTFIGFGGREFQIELREKGGNRYDAYLRDTAGGLVDNRQRTLKLGLLRRTSAGGGGGPPAPESESFRENLKSFPDITKPYINLGVKNLPNGLKVSYIFHADNRTITVELSGEADPHKNINDEPNLRFSFAGDFEDSAGPGNTLAAFVDFIDVPITAKIQGNFSELDNTGRIDKRVDIKFNADLAPTPGLIDGEYIFGFPASRPTHMRIDDEWITIDDDIKATYKGTEISMLIRRGLTSIIIPDLGIKARKIQFKSEGNATLPAGVGPEFTLEAPGNDLVVTSPNLETLTELKLSYVVIDPRTVRIALDGEAHPHFTDIDNLRFEFGGTFKTGEAPPPPIVDASIDFNLVVPTATIDVIFSEKMFDNNGLIAGPATISLGDDVIIKHRYSQSSLYTNNLNKVDLLRFDFPDGSQERVDQVFVFNKRYTINVRGIEYEVSVGRHTLASGAFRAFIDSDKKLPTSVHFSLVDLAYSDAHMNVYTNETRNPVITMKNKPEGLTEIYTILNTSQVEVSFQGNAFFHDKDEYDEDNLEFNFTGGIFSSGSNPPSITDASVNFFNNFPPGIVRFESTFSEIYTNKGNVVGVIVDLGDRVKTGTLEPEFKNIPDGLAVSYRLLAGNNKIFVELSGEAVSHRLSHSVDNLTFSFRGDFSAWSHPITASNGKIEFVDYVLIADRASFTESDRNDGKIDVSLNITLTNGIFRDNAEKDIVLKGLPANLEATFQLTSLSNIKVNLTGRARSHQSFDSLQNLFFDFDDDIIQKNDLGINYTHINNEIPLLVSNTKRNIAKNVELTFTDNVQPITTINDVFSEVDINNGTIRRELTLSLNDDYYSRPIVSTDLRNKAPGLSAIFTHINTSQVLVTIVGSARNHRDEDDVDDLYFTFTGGDFSSGLIPLEMQYASIDFLDPEIEIDGDIFSETFLNRGAIGTTLNLHITYGLFVNDIFEKISLTDLPAGLKANFVRKSDKNIQITLQDMAHSHANKDDRDGLSNPFLHLNFRNDLIKYNGTNLNNLPITFNGSNVKDSIIIDFVEGSVSLKTNTFKESEIENDGSISNTITLRFDTSIVDAIIKDDIILHRLPDNLVASYKVNQEEREIIVSLTGKALSHTKSDDVDDLFFSFSRHILENSVQLGNVSGVSIDFFETDIIPSGTTFYESRGDIGSIQTIITLSITGNTIRDGVGFNALQDLISASALPDNISAVFKQINASNIEVRLVDEALSHDSINNITDLSFSFNPSIFETPTKRQSVENIHIDFFTRPTINIDPASIFSEQEDNVGYIDNSITFKLTGDTFSNIATESLADYIEAKNIPDNLSIAYKLISPQKIQVTLKGNALSHDNKDDVNNLLFDFNPSIVATNAIISSVQSKIDFFDIPILRVNQGFVESVANDGSIRAPITINIAEGTQFSGITSQARWEELISIDNLPANLSARYRLVAGSNNLKLEVSLKNNALLHTDSSDIDDLVFNFDKEAFYGGAYNVKAYTNIDFYDIPVITLSPNLVESINNDGSIGNESIFLIKGDTWNVKEDFSYANVAFRADNLDIEKIIVDGVDILNSRNSMSLDDVIQQMGYNTNGVGVTTNNGKLVTIYAAKESGKLIFYSNEIDEGDSISVQFKLMGYGFDNADSLKDNPLVSHSFGQTGSVDSKDIGRYITPSNLPLGLTPSYTFLDGTRIKIKIEGATPEIVQQDVQVLFSFDDILLNHRLPANEPSALIDFIDRATLTLNAYTFSESKTEAGEIDTIIELNVSGDGLTDRRTAIDAGYYKVNGLPNNLIASFAINATDDDKINISLSGVALSHRIKDNLKNLSLRVNPLAFSSTLNAFNDKGESSNVIENISLNFLEEVNITADEKSFFEHLRNDGSIRNKITFDIEGGARLRQIEKNLKYGFNIPLANAKENGFIIIGGRRFDNFDSSDSLQVIAKKLTSDLNAGGVGSFIAGESMFAKVSGSSILILKDRNDGIVVNSRLGTDTILPSASLSVIDKTIELNDPSLNIGQNISFKLSDFDGLVPNFTPLNATQIEMELTGVALKHTKADSATALNINVEFSSGLFETIPSNFDDANKPRQKVNIVFLDTASLSVSGKFKEANTNKGEINNIINPVKISFTNDSIIGTLSNTAIADYITLRNVPAGLTPSYLVNGARNELTINLNNQALSHDVSNSVDSIEVEFNKDMFLMKANFEPIKNIELDFIESSKITASPKVFQESDANTGLIGNTIILTIENGEIRAVPRTILEPRSIDGRPFTFDSGGNAMIIDGERINFDAPINPAHSGVGPFIGTATDAAGITYALRSTTTGGGSLRSFVTIDTGGRKLASTILFLPSPRDPTITVGEYVKVDQLHDFINLVNVPAGLSAEYSYIDSKHIEVTLSSTIAGGVSGAVKHSSADDLSNLRFEFNNKLLNNDYLIEDTRDISIDFGSNINLVALNNVFSEEFTANDGSIDRTITLEVQDGDIKNEIKNFTFASRIDDIILEEIATYGVFKIDGIDLADKNANRYYIDSTIRDLTDEQIRAYHIASVINNGYRGTTLANGDKLFANVVKVGANYQVFLLKNTATSVMLDTDRSTNSFANDNKADPNVRAMIMPNLDSKLDDYAAYINVPLGLTPKFKALTKNLIEVELRGKATSHLVVQDDHNVTKNNQLEFTFSPHAFIDTLHVSHAGGINVSFIDNVVNNDVSFLEADFIGGTISAPYIITFENGILNTDTPRLDLDKNISASNVPTGLIPTYSYITGVNNKLEISFKGTALSHRPENSIDDLTFHFDRDLFSEGGGSTTTRGIGKITYINQPILEFRPTVIRERSDNIGWIEHVVSIHISDGVLDDGLKDFDGDWVDSRLTNLISAGVPQSIYTSWHIVNASNIVAFIEGPALSHTPSDSSGIRYDFNNMNIMQGHVVADDISYNVTTKDGIYLSFLGKNTFKDVDDFTEVDVNTGAISNTIIIEVSEGGGIANQYYRGSVITTNASGESLITVDNLPTGLIPFFTKGAGDSILVRLDGIASRQRKAHSTDINFTFHADLMSLGLASDVVSNVNINFIDVISLSFETNKFVEDSADVGDFSAETNHFGRVVISLSDGELSTAGYNRNVIEKRLQENIVVHNLDTLQGLSISFEYIDSTTIHALMRGQTMSHESPTYDLNNINGLTFSFKPMLMVDDTIVRLSDVIAVDFINRANLEIATGKSDKFSEHVNNNGAIRHTGNVVVRSTNDVNFTNSIATVNANVSYINLPAGLSAKFIFADNTGFSALIIQLTDQADNHTTNYDVNNVQFEFKTGAFDHAIATKTPNLSIDFNDNVQLDALGRFVESVDNDGSIANRVIVKIEGDYTFDLVRAANHVPGPSDISITGQPNGLGHSYRVISPKELEIELKGKVTDPDGHGIDDNKRITVSFDNKLFNENSANANAVHIPIDFVDPPRIEIVNDLVNSGKFLENLENDGSIKNEITLRISNGVIDDNIDINSLITPINLSPDYKASFRVDNASTIIASLTGKSILHTSNDSSSDLDFSFDGAIFESGIKPNDLKNISIDYIDAIKTFKQGYFEEGGLNKGKINESKKVTITLIGDTFKGAVDDDGKFKVADDLDINTYTNLSNLPDGYRYNASVTNNKTVVLSLTGGDTKHHPTDSIKNISLRFDRKDMFVSGISPQDVKNIELKYIDYANTAVDSHFTESNDNDGSLNSSSKAVVSLIDDLYSNISDIASMIQVKNLPEGLTPKYELSASRRDLIITFDGKAKLHNKSHSKTVDFDFINTSLFLKGIVPDTVKTKINFFNSSSSTYTGKFIESNKNIGTFESSEVIVSLEGDIFKGDLIDIDISNLPDDTITYTTRIVSDNAIGITLLGEVKDITKRSSANNRKVNIDFTNVANFRSGTLPKAITDVPLEFVNSPDVEVTGRLIETVQDKGEIGGSLVFTINRDTFDISKQVANLITISYDGRELAGLTVEAKFNNISELEFSFAGKGFNHIERKVPFEISFDPTLFTKGIALEPQKSEVTFIKLGELKLANDLIESLANDGSIRESLTINIENGSFSDTKNINDYTKAENLPIGITSTFSYVNTSTLEVSFSGNALSHKEINSLSDIKISLGKEVIANEIPLSMNNIQLDFLDAPILIYDNNFNESKLDDGSIANGINVTITDDVIKKDFDPAKYMKASYTDKNAIKINTLPDGLSFASKIISDNRFILFLKGNATNHNSLDNINDLEITMSGDFLKESVAPTPLKNLKVIYSDTPQFTLAPATGFLEGLKDVGAISNKVTIDMTGDLFNANVDVGSFVNISNLPVGLSLNFEVDRLDNSKLILELSGNARLHSEKDIRTLKIDFLEGLFRKRIPITGVEVPIVFTTSNSFTVKESFIESFENDGTIKQPILLSLKGSTMRNVNPTSFIKVNNLPEGLQAAFSVVDETTLEMTLRNNAASHSEVNSTTNDNIPPISLGFAPGLFNNNIAAKPLDVIHVRFIDPPVVSTKGKFIEDYTNDGSINTAITFTVINDLFSTDQNLAPLIEATGIPAGLKIEYKAITDNRIIAFLTGKADEHTKEDNTKVDFTFKSGLFNNGLVPPPAEADVLFDSIRPAFLKVDGEFVEDIQNDGSIATSIIINILDDKISDNYKFPFSMLIDDIRDLVGYVGDDEGESTFTLDGVLFENIIVQKDAIQLTDTQVINSLVERINNKGAGTNGLYAELTIDKQGLPHLNILKHIENRTVNTTGFTGTFLTLENHYNFGDEGYIREQTALGLDPNDPALAIDRTVTAREVKVEYVLDRLIFDQNLPDGLRSRFTLLDKNRVLVEIDRKAFKHGSKDSIDDYTITFAKEAFDKKLAPAVLDNIPIKFQNPAIRYEGSFVESDNNDGSIKGALTLFLTGDEFKDDIDKQLLNGFFAVDNLPDGLIGNFIIEAKDVVRFELIGKAREHEIADSLQNMSVSFNERLFKNGVAADKIDLIPITFIDSIVTNEQGGGSGSEGGYITFISPRGSNLTISAGGANFGVEGIEHQSTIKLIDVFNNQFSTDELYSIGDEKHPYLTQLNGGYGVGVTSKESATVFLDTVDAAINELNQTRQRLSSFYQRIQQAGEVLSVEKINLKSANSRLVDIDFAEESAQFNRSDILSKAANFALTQANSLQRDKINSLLDGIK